MIANARFMIAAAFAASALVASFAPAAADAPTLLGVSQSWSAYQTGSGMSKVCYALSKPKSVDPRKATRDPIFFLISDWPMRRAKAEPEIVPGYQYKVGSKVTAQVGSDKFEFFTKNEDGAGSAWVKDNTDEARLIDAMKRGSQVIVTGISQRGTMTRDTYTLDGISTMLDKIHTACGF